MTAMGPEAALLSARLAEYRATRLDREAELPAESPMWLEAAVRAGADDDARERESVSLWARLRGAAALGTEGEPGDEVAHSLACLPLRTPARR
ncbi:MAG TPA: hypothetical protein VMC82_03185 [Thermoplasmata archaeon]|nr:hypothetical protein [Thermoplasmata archaeon]